MGKVLVVDDDRMITTLVAAILREADHEVVASNDAVEAMEMASGSTFDAIVLDVMMPGISGYEILTKLRRNRRTSATPVLFLTSLDQGKDRVRGLREGADDYMVKPFEPEEVLIRVERLISSRPEPIGSSLEELSEQIKTGRPLKEITLGRYELRSVLGKGAMGMVLRAWDPKLQRQVALKTVGLGRDIERSRQSELLSGLLQEAISVAQLNHPNVLAVYDVVDNPGAACIVMELIDGVSLDAYLKACRSLVSGEVIPLAAAIARGLAAAHASDLVHHDVKPGNVLLGRDGVIKVNDFGLAHFLTVLADKPHQLFGTPGYLPPETLLGQGYDQTADLFGLGVILYQCLTGDRPFRSDTVLGVVQRTIQFEPLPPRKLVRSVPRKLDNLVMELLAKDAQNRPQNASEVISRLNDMGADLTYQWQPNLLFFEDSNVEPDEVYSSRLITTTIGDEL
jgi:serine/threonine-protein kinase